MDLNAPVSTIMTKELITVDAHERLLQAQELFRTFRIHHLLVTEEDKLVGILSKTDLLHFIDFMIPGEQEAYLTRIRLRKYRIGELMTSDPITVHPEDSIRVALEVFRTNLFRALPVVSRDKLLGIVTPHDIITSILENETESSIS